MWNSYHLIPHCIFLNSQLLLNDARCYRKVVNRPPLYIIWCRNAILSSPVVGTGLLIWIQLTCQGWKTFLSDKERLKPRTSAFFLLHRCTSLQLCDGSNDIFLLALSCCHLQFVITSHYRWQCRKMSYAIKYYLILI